MENARAGRAGVAIVKACPVGRRYNQNPGSGPVNARGAGGWARLRGQMGRTTFGIPGAVRGALAIATGAGLWCCAPGCFGAGAGREPARLTSNNPDSKIPAIKRASAGADVENDPRETRTAQQLVKSLESDDPAVRFYAIRGLQALTGETFGYVWYADDGDRHGALTKWKEWVGTGEPGKVVEGNGGAAD